MAGTDKSACNHLVVMLVAWGAFSWPRAVAADVRDESLRLALAPSLDNRYGLAEGGPKPVEAGGYPRPDPTRGPSDVPRKLAMSYELASPGMQDTPKSLVADPEEILAAQNAGGVQGAAPQVTQGNPSPGGNRDLPTDDSQPLRGIRWSLAPIRWGGNAGYEWRAQTSQGQPTSTSQFTMTNINASSYIWQPWFAQVTGGLGLVNGSSQNGGLSSSSDSVTGNLGLSLLPVSRFPFFAGVDVSDSRTSGAVTASDFRSYRLNLRQSYRPIDGTTNYTTSYQRSTLTSSAFGRDTLDVLEGNMTKNFGAQFLEINGNHSRNSAGLSGASSILNRINVRHTYRPDALLWVESLGSINKSDFQQPSGGAVSSAGTQFIQLNSFANWRPDEEIPLQVTGGARFFTLDNQANGVDSKSQSVSANVGANYDLNHHTRVSGGANVAQTTSPGASVVTTGQNASIAYSPDFINLGKFDYRWNAAGSATNSTGGDTGSRQTVTGQASHNLLRNVPLADTSVVGFNFGQSYSAAYDAAAATSQTLSNTAAATWNKTQEAVTTYASLSATDSRTLGRNSNEFQLINLQASRNTQLSRGSFWAGSLTLQATRQSSAASPAGGFNTFTSGNLVYQHQRAFGIPRLRYYANLTVSSQQFASRLTGDVNAPRERISSSFENRLDYTIGRTDLSLTARIAEIDGQRNGLIFFRLNRQFGGF